MVIGPNNKLVPESKMATPDELTVWLPTLCNHNGFDIVECNYIRTFISHHNIITTTCVSKLRGLMLHISFAMWFMHPFHSCYGLRGLPVFPQNGKSRSRSVLMVHRKCSQ